MINPTNADINISKILAVPDEGRGIEFKESFSWALNIDGLQSNNKAQEVIRSILGMSNIKDGGKIFIGVRQGKDPTEPKFVSKGMNENDLNTYDQDLIFEQVRNFGKPEPQFQILNMEYEGKYFILFNVQSFLFAPIICYNYKHLNRLEMSALYIRTFKPETKKVTEVVEMREIVELAIEKELDLFSARMQRVFQTMSGIKIGKSSEEEEQKKFSGELKDVL